MVVLVDIFWGAKLSHICMTRRSPKAPSNDFCPDLFYAAFTVATQDSPQPHQPPPHRDGRSRGHASLSGRQASQAMREAEKGEERKAVTDNEYESQDDDVEISNREGEDLPCPAGQEEEGEEEDLCMSDLPGLKGKYGSKTDDVVENRDESSATKWPLPDCQSHFFSGLKEGPSYDSLRFNLCVRSAGDEKKKGKTYITGKVHLKLLHSMRFTQGDGSEVSSLCTILAG